jgi:hypothetical protein
MALLKNRISWIVLLLGCSILAGAILRRVHEDTRPDVTPLLVPAYPNAHSLIVAPLELPTGVLSRTQTTFTTTDQPALLRDWYITTLQRLGWTADASNAAAQGDLAFTDQRGCPASHARITWKAAANGSTTVAVEYSADACIRWNQRPHTVVPLTVPPYPNARIQSVAPLSNPTQNTIVSSRIIFETPDSPDTLHAWYKTTLYAMGWEGDESRNMTSDPDRHYFSDHRGCPGAEALIDWEEPIDGITTVAVEYYVANCRR